ncbi:MAG: tetratricopeptide repeat protein [Candidatus Gastranaerophilaceae bacterium]|jgi:tetratricopeptide (TPR) repeat protein
MLKPEELYNKGIVLYENQDYGNAIDNFKQCVEANPNNPTYYYNLGLAYVKVLDYNKAIDILKKGLALNPKDYDTNYNLGIAYYESKNYQEAVKFYQAAIDVNPKDAAGYDSLGSTYYALNEFDLALNNFKKASSIAPNNPTMLYNLAYTYYIKENYGDACITFEKVVTLNPSDEEAFFNLANAYLKLQKYKKAINNYKIVLSINPEHDETKKLLNELQQLINSGKIVIEEQKDEVSTEQSNVEKQEPIQETLPAITEEDTSITIYWEAKQLLKQRNLIPAVEKLKKVVELNPNNKLAVNDLNDTERLLKTSIEFFENASRNMDSENYKTAIEFYKQALVINPFYEEASSKLNHAESIYQKVKIEKIEKIVEEANYTEAINRFKDFVAENPNNPKGHFRLGNVYRLNKEYDLALDSLKTAMSLDPNNKEVQGMLFEVIKLVNTSNDETRDYIQLALIYVNKNEHAKAFESLKKALEANPDNLKVRKAVEELITVIFKQKSSLISESNVNQVDAKHSIKKYMDILDKNPKDIDAQYNLSLLYKNLNQNDNALNYVKKVLSLAPNHKQAQALMFELFQVSNGK